MSRSLNQDGFWARRRAGVAAEAEAEEIARVQQADAEMEAVHESKSDAELLEELGLPDPADLKMGDDFSVFMSKTVPDRLRKQALRTLWRSNPVLANLDGLNDYECDYTDAATVQVGMKTAYQVGKGMLAHIQEMARQAEEKAAVEDRAGELEKVGSESGPELTVVETASNNAIVHKENETDIDEVQGLSQTFQEDGEADTSPTTQRRMRFTFVEAGVA